MMFLNRLSAWTVRWARAISLLGLLSALVAGYFSFLLFSNLRLDLEELLPLKARSVVDFNEVTRRLKLTDNLGILVFSENSENKEASKKFVVDLVNRIESLPSSVVAGVEYRMDEEIRFFERRSALYMDLEDLREIHDFVRDRIFYEIELFNPLTIFRTTELPEPILDESRLAKKYEKEFAVLTQFPDGFYATTDEKVRAILVYLPSSDSKMETAYRLRGALDQIVDELNPLSYAPDIKVHYTGTVQDMIEEQESVMSDLGFVTVFAIFLVALAMFIYFQTFRATAALVVSLLIGTAWTFGISYFLVDYLNSNSAFLGAIVVGNGVNFGIIFLARYLEERRKGSGHETSLLHSFRGTARATWVAALAAGLAYGSLMATDFRGFNQFGVMGLVGMVLCWLSAFTLLPAFLTVLDRSKPLFSSEQKVPIRPVSKFYSLLVKKAPIPILIFSAILTVVSILSLREYDDSVIETDLNKLRDKRSLESGSGYYTQFLDQIFKRSISPIVLLPQSRDQALEIAQKLREKKEREKDKSLISKVYTIHDSVPSKQPQKIRLLRQIRSRLPQVILNELDSEQKQQVDFFLNPDVFRPVGIEDLPEMIRKKFTEKDGSSGKLVILEQILNMERLTPIGEQIAFIDDVRKIADSISPQTPVAGDVPVSTDLIRSIQNDGPRVTAIAFSAVVLLVIVLFRNFTLIALVLSALFIGVSWLAGAILIFGYKINIMNFIALPITFGIGVDYAVNVIQRYAQSQKKDILEVVRESGGAVGLASLTTIIGYGSLVLAGNQALASFGQLAVIGEVACLFTAVLTIPAVLRVCRNRS